MFLNAKENIRQGIDKLLAVLNYATFCEKYSISLISSGDSVSRKFFWKILQLYLLRKRSIWNILVILLNWNMRYANLEAL